MIARRFLRNLCLAVIFGCAGASEAREPDPAPTLLTPAKEKELFDALDLNSESLRPVAEAAARGDSAQAVHELAQYYRHRTSPVWKLKPPAPPNAVAADALKGRVQGGLVQAWHTFPDNNIDWHYNETLATPGLAHNNEWQWQLCRMAFWSDLGDAYRATHDDRYTRAFVTEFRSFIAQCPVPAKVDNGPGSAWRTIECGIRMGYSWPHAFFSFLPSAQFTDDDVALFVDSCLEHARYLRQFPSAGGNWVTMEMAGLYTVGAYFPEFKEAAEWRDFAAQRSAREETAQFLPDGAQFELSTMYHNVSLDNLVTIARVSKNVGRFPELPAGYVAGLEKAFDFDLYMMTPDRSLPEFNDSTSWPNSVKAKCQEALQFFPGRADYQWVATDGKEGHPPAETSHAFDWAGYYVMRSSWDTDANYFVLRAGPLGYGHWHQDKLNVVLWSYGRQILFNSGGGSYEESKWHTYSIESFSKNTVLVDGKPQERQFKDRFANIAKAPTQARWESTPDHDFAAGVYAEGYGAVDARIATHTRRVLFVKPDLFVIADTLVPNDGAAHTYQARWNLLTTHTVENARTHAVTTADQGESNLALIPLLTDGLDVRSASAQTEPELLGWDVRKDSNPALIPATTVLHTLQGAGTKNFLTLLVPLAKGTNDMVASVQPAGTDGAVVTFADGRKLAITADPAPSGGMELVETLANGAPGRHVKIAPAVSTPDAVSPATASQTRPETNAHPGS